MAKYKPYKSGRAQLDSQCLTRESKIIARSKLALCCEIGKPPEFTLSECDKNNNSDDENASDHSEESCFSADNTDNEEEDDAEEEIEKQCSIKVSTDSFYRQGGRGVSGAVRGQFSFNVPKPKQIIRKRSGRIKGKLKKNTGEVWGRGGISHNSKSIKKKNNV